jgi:hypothetical protein
VSSQASSPDADSTSVGSTQLNAVPSTMAVAWGRGLPGRARGKGTPCGARDAAGFAAGGGR